MNHCNTLNNVVLHWAAREQAGLNVFDDWEM